MLSPLVDHIVEFYILADIWCNSFIICWKRNVEVSNRIFGFVYCSFQFYQFLLHTFCIFFGACGTNVCVCVCVCVYFKDCYVFLVN